MIVAVTQVMLLFVSAVDPLDGDGVDADRWRDVACDLTEPDRICNPRAPEPSELPDPPPVSPPSAGGGGSFLSTAVTVVLVVALLAAIVWLVMRLRTDEGVDDEDEDLDESIDAVLGDRIIDEASPPQRWRAAADEHRARGEFRDAVRCRYRALVGDLARAGYVDEIPGRTSGEERSQVAETVERLGRSDAAEVAPSFDRAASIFDAAWFDDDEVTEADLDRFLAAESVVLQVVASGPASRLRAVGSRR